jgi:hypothetical protein
MKNHLQVLKIETSWEMTFTAVRMFNPYKITSWERISCVVAERRKFVISLFTSTLWKLLYCSGEALQHSEKGYKPLIHQQNIVMLPVTHRYANGQFWQTVCLKCVTHCQHPVYHLLQIYLQLLCTVYFKFSRIFLSRTLLVTAIESVNKQI